MLRTIAIQKREINETEEQEMKGENHNLINCKRK
jgi:hypothetical protein